MDKKKSPPVPAVGGSALLTIFAVLCLMVFALLSLSTALSGERLTEASTASTENYYAASFEAESILARIRGGEIPDGVCVSGDTYSYSCPIGESAELRVEIELSGGEWTVLRWQSVPTVDWENDTSLPVWDGN